MRTAGRGLALALALSAAGTGLPAGAREAPAASKGAADSGLPTADARAADAAPPEAEPRDTGAPARLDAIVVTASRRGQPAHQVPASVDVRTAPATGAGVNLSEWLAGVPGLLARDRQNHAQDTQFSLRGTGSRAGFGIRGVRVIIDDIPATQPDGQSQVSHANLASAEVVEVLRGPFSVLHGQATGGVIRLDSGEGRSPASGRAGVAAGGGRDTRASATLRARGERLGLVLGASAFRSEGLRPQSAARRDSFNARLHLEAPDLALVLNHLDAPLAEDPLGLTPAQFAEDALQTAAPALAFDTRKSVRQTQAGLVWRPRAGAVDLKAIGYGGRRAVRQFLAVPVATQANPLQSGGVVDLQGDYAGVELQASGGWTMPAGEWRWTAGLAWEALWQRRRGFENFADGRLGVQGALRRDEANRVASLDPYLQVDGPLSRRWWLQAGLRHSSVRFRSRDRYVAAGNPDDSGAVAYSQLAPVAGLRFEASPALDWHASVGAGFETPTLAELAYRPDGGSGLNLDLEPARTRVAELGLKWRPQPGLRLDAAVFRADTRGELVVVANSGGRASFGNAARTRREGAELSLDAALGERWTLGVAATWLRARVAEPYLACASAPCAAPTLPVARGTPLPGLPRQHAWARLAWQPRPAWSVFAEGQAMAAVPVDDRGSARAPGYALLSLGLVRESGPVRAWLRLDNATDRRHVGSVIVGEANGRWFEPGPGRTLWLGLDLMFEGRD